MKMFRQILLAGSVAAALLGCCPGSVLGALLEQGTLDSAVKPMFSKNCLECHGPKKQKGGLRLDELAPNFEDRDSAAHWLRVMERIESGEMPPKDEEQPDVAAAKKVAGWIDANLFAADAARRTREGRGRVRRLNRDEYEYTLHDLLAIDVPLKDLLPEDGTGFGFDKVGDALDISSVLLDRFLQAADTALDAAIFHTPQSTAIHQTFTYEGDAMNQRIPITRDLGEGANFARVFFLSNENPPTHLKKFKAPASGRYRFRVAAYAFQSEKPVTYRIYTAELFRRDAEARLIGHFLAEPLKDGHSPINEFEVRLEVGQTIKFMPYDLAHDIYRVGATTYPGAGLAVQTVEVEGPLYDSWPPESHRKLFGDLPLEPTSPKREGKKGRTQTPRLVVTSKDPADDAERVIRAFAPRAFRRPVTDEDCAPYVKLALDRLKAGYEFDKAVRVGLDGILCSPDFLLIEERPGRLTDEAIASRLSYFLWSSCPDDELLRLAAEKKLGQPPALQAQVERMLKDPRAARFTRNFVGQWLNLREIDATLPDKTLYPEFDEYLKVSMVGETEAFFSEVLRTDQSVLTFVDSDFAMLNERLARHYGIEGVSGPAYRKVPLPPGSHRGGVLGQAAVLKVTANGTTTSPVIRGKFVAERILGEHIPGPPSGVPAVEPDIRGATTIREQLAKHRDNASCALCHVKIDPYGFALENYDVIGGWRSFYRSTGEGSRVETRIRSQGVKYRRGKEVDAGDALPDGRKFGGVDEFKKLVDANPERIARCLAEKLVIYSTGSGIGYADRRAVKEIVESVREKNFGLKTLVLAVVQSPLFLNK
jgi:mono/diheme cytochrome c family protein